MSARAVFVPQLRGACPGLSAPMETGDGLLVRLLPVGTIPLGALTALCDAAGRYGNGIVEITSRGSIQIRGLSAASAPRFTDAVAALNIAASDGIPVLTGALAGIDAEELVDSASLTDSMRAILAESSLALAPKVSVIVDGNGALTLDDVTADVRLLAQRFDGNTVFHIAAGGDAVHATPVGLVTQRDAITAVIRVLTVVAQHGRYARARDIVAAKGAAPFRDAVADLLVADAPPRERAKSRDAMGMHRLRNGSLARGIGIAFGHTDAHALARLADVAAGFGADGMRAAPGRTLIAVGLTEDAAASLGHAAATLGFVVDGDDPRRHVFACAGAPICASARLAAREIAPRTAAVAAPYLGASFQVHISGCAKGCAHAAPTALTIVGTADGCGLVANGTSRDAPFETVAARELYDAIARVVATKRREMSHV